MSKNGSRVVALTAAGLTLSGIIYQKLAQNYYNHHFRASLSKNPQDYNFSFKTIDGHNIKGLILEAQNSNRYMICLNDHLTSLSKMLDFGRGFQALNYNVVLFDGRGQGLSEGVETMGLKEQFDVASVVNWVFEKDPGAHISLFGIGTGALAAILATRGAIGIDAIIAVNAPNKLLKDVPAHLLPGVAQLIKKNLAISLHDNLLADALTSTQVPICFVAEERCREDSLYLFEQYPVTRKYYPLRYDLTEAANDSSFFKNIDDFIVSID